MRTRLGIDIGGTKIEGVVLREDPSGELRILHRRRIPTERERGYEALVERAAAFTRNMLSLCESEPEHIPIGIGMPGGLTRGGLVKNSNTTCLNGRPFREDLQKKLSRSITFENDANCKSIRFRANSYNIRS